MEGFSIISRMQKLAAAGPDDDKERQQVGATHMAYVLVENGIDHAIVEPLSANFRLAVCSAGCDDNHALSRFAYIRPIQGRLVVESPGVHCRFTLLSAEASTLFAASTVFERRLDPATCALWDFVHRAAFTTERREADPFDTEAWEFHDRVFHDRSRISEAAQPFGATWRFRDRYPSPAALKPPLSSEAVALRPPHPDDIQSAPLLDLMEKRRSIRRHGAAPITLGDLQEFFRRAARVTEQIPSPLQDGLRHPFPLGGAVHEIEFYLAVHVCDGLDQSLYPYNGGYYALYRLPSGTAERVHAPVMDGALAWGTPDNLPQVVVILASRLPAWKAESTAYRTTLIDAGIIQQTMSLVATDMGLAGCPIGFGNSQHFAVASGLDSFAETSVSEFALGVA